MVELYMFIGLFVGIVVGVCTVLGSQYIINLQNDNFSLRSELDVQNYMSQYRPVEHTSRVRRRNLSEQS